MNLENQITNCKSQPTSRREWLKSVSALFGVGLGIVATSGCQLFSKRNAQVLDLDYMSSFNAFSYYLDPTLFERPPKRILALWSQATMASDAIQLQFCELVASQFRQARISEVVLDQRNQSCHCDLDAILSGRFNEYSLLDVTGRYNADTLMITRINSINDLWPLSISATVVMIDRHDAIVTMAADGHWDLNNKELLKSYQSFTRNFSGDTHAKVVEAKIRSPRQVQSFIAWQIAKAVQDQLCVCTNG